jgi:3'-5' exoribonuclease
MQPYTFTMRVRVSGIHLPKVPSWRPFFNRKQNGIAISPDSALIQGMDLLPISALRQAAQNAQTRIEALVHAQVESVEEKQSRDSKPYWEVVLADAESRFTLRAWSDSPNFEVCAGLKAKVFLEIEGEFSLHPMFGLEAKRWACRELNAVEIEDLLSGPKALREKQVADFVFISETVSSLLDPRLKALAELFLHDFGDRFRRCAAARNYHHARRGGLVEHVAQMLRTADKITEAYPHLNRDLLLTGVLFHDVGKLWENCPEAAGFAMPYDERGELIGHITVGIELFNSLWRKLLSTPEATTWHTLQPSSDDVRNHLIHLIAAHHGEMQFGSPVFPTTPEAYALHYIDNLDAKLEMMAAGYETGKPLADRIIERVRPLPANLVKPLARFQPASDQTELFEESRNDT